MTPGGAEADYYAVLEPPCLPRNGPLQTTRELLMVRGVSRELLLGESANQDGALDSVGNDSPDSSAADRRAGIPDEGWSGILTVDSSVENVNAAGEDRVNVQSANEASLASIRGISSDIAKAIVAYRGQNRLENLADLLDVVAVQNQNPPAPQGNPAQSPIPPNSPTPASSPTGPRVISEELFLDVADDFTTESGQLMCLPGIDQELAQAIVSYRQSSGFFPNIAWLLKVPGMNQQIFKQLAPRVSARSETFRILSEGKVRSTGTRQRIEEIVHVRLRDIDVLSYREGP